MPSMKWFVVLGLLIVGAAVWWSRSSEDSPRATRASPPPGESRAPPAPEPPSHVVVDSEGRPIPGVAVQWQEQWEEHELRTDELGRFDWTGERELLTFRSEGFARHTAWSDQTRVILLPAQAFSGRAVDRNGESVGGVTLQVTVTEEEDPAEQWYLEAKTGRDGRFALDELPVSRLSIWCYSDGWTTSGPVETWSGVDDAAVVLDRMGSGRGRVVDEAGEPVVGATIVDANRAYLSSDGNPGGVEFAGEIAASGGDGTFRFESVVGRTHRVFAHFEGRRSVPASITAGGDAVTITVPDEATHRSFVRVRVLDPDGNPAKRAEVRWSRRAHLPPGAIRNPDGTAALPPMPTETVSYSPTYYYTPELESDEYGDCTFEFPLPPSSPMEFFVEHHDKDTLPCAIACETQPDAVHEPFEALLRRGVRRRLRLESGGKGYNAFLDVAGPCRELGVSGSESFVYLFDPRARYSIHTDPFLNRTVVLDPSWRPPAEDVLTVFELPGRERVDLGSEEATTIRVRDVRGAPLPRAWCIAEHPSYRGMPAMDWWIVPANRHGVVRTARHPELTRRIGAPGHGTICAPSTTDEVRLPSEARLRVRLDFPGRWRPHDWRLDVQAASWTWPDPMRCRLASAESVSWSPAAWYSMYEEMYRFGIEQTAPAGAHGMLENLPPGPCRLRIWTSNYEEVAEVELRAGETATVVFRGR